jgi:hypothetical protein
MRLRRDRDIANNHLMDPLSHKELRSMRLANRRTLSSRVELFRVSVPVAFAQSIKTTQRPVRVCRGTARLSAGFRPLQ